MKKLGLTLISCIALVAFMGMSGSAVADTIDPSCDGSPYNNDPVIHDFRISTTTPFEHQVAGIGGHGLVCGSTATVGARDSIYSHADIDVAPGVKVNPTSGITTGSFSGAALFNMASTAGMFTDQPAQLTVRPVSECVAEDSGPLMIKEPGHATGTIIACHRADSALGHNWDWTTDRGPGLSPVLTIGPVHAIFRAGLTHIKAFDFCARAGAVGGTTYPDDCGSGTAAPALQRNGDTSWTGHGAQCADYVHGVYKAKAVQYGGLVTPTVVTCVPWLPTVTPRPGATPLSQSSAPIAGPKDEVPLLP